MASACLPTPAARRGDRRRAVLGRRLQRQPGAVAAAARRARRRSAGGDVEPLVAGRTPTTADGIQLRTVEIAFNAAFLREMRLIADATAAARRPWWRGPLERRLRRVRCHLIDVHDALAELPPISKAIAHPQRRQRLRDAAAAAGRRLVERHAGSSARARAHIARWFGRTASRSGPSRRRTRSPDAGAAEPGILRRGTRAGSGSPLRTSRALARPRAPRRTRSDTERQPKESPHRDTAAAAPATPPTPSRCPRCHWSTSAAGAATACCSRA